jgi:hypothetical protein
VDYPIKHFSTVHEGQAMFTVLGEPRLYCRLRIIPNGRSKLPKIKVMTERDGTQETLQARETPEGHIEYTLFGDRTVIVQWEAKNIKSRPEKDTANGNKNGRKGRKK